MFRVCFFLLLALFIGCGCADSSDRQSVYLFSDTGCAADDFFAIREVLDSPVSDLKMIVSDGKYPEKSANAACWFLNRCGRTDIPVGQGMASSDGNDHPLAILAAGKKYPFESDGVGKFLREIAKESSDVVVIILGPATSFAEALRRSPELAGKCRVFISGGSFTPGVKEWNILCDIPGAQYLFKTEWKYTPVVIPFEAGFTLTADKVPSDPALKEVALLWRKVNPFGHKSSHIIRLFDVAAVRAAENRNDLDVSLRSVRLDDDGVTRTGGKRIFAILNKVPQKNNKL